MLPNTSIVVLEFGFVIEPNIFHWQVIVDFLLVEVGAQVAWFGYFGSEEDAAAHHELSIDVVGIWVVGELVPHWSHEGLCCTSHPFKYSVQIVDEGVSLIDWGADCGLNTLRLKPWFAVRCVDFGVGAEKWIPCTQLVELNVEIVSWFSVEAGNIRSTVRMSTQAQLEQHIDWSLELFVDCIVISSPESAILLAAKEERSCEDERTPLIIVSLHDTFVGAFLMQGTISIMDISVFIRATICFPVQHIQRHRVWICIENWWLIHVVPKVV